MLKILFCKHIKQFSKKIPNYPLLNLSEIEENVIKGCGPGGSKINKSLNCVQLIHTPTGIIVKCQQDRSLDRNRKIARQKLQEKLDFHFNGENSVLAQNKRLELEKELKNSLKIAKRREKLQLFKEKLNLFKNLSD